MTLTIKDQAIIPSTNVTAFNKFLTTLALDADVTLTYSSSAISGSSNYRYNYTLSYTPSSTSIEQKPHLHNAQKNIKDGARAHGGY